MVSGQCDRCGAAAKARVSINAVDLHFCDHHFRANREKLARFPFTLAVDSVHYEEPVMV